MSLNRTLTILSFLPYVMALSGATAADVAPPETLVYQTIGSRDLKAFVFSMESAYTPRTRLQLGSGRTPADTFLIPFHTGSHNLARNCHTTLDPKRFRQDDVPPIRIFKPVGRSCHTEQLPAYFRPEMA
jgi:hypothetical protein